MTITLTMKEDAELWAEARQNSLQTLSQELLELLCEVPRQLGKGYERYIEVYPQLWLTIGDYEYHDEVHFKIPDWDHPVQFAVQLSGNTTDSFGQIGGGYTLVSGSGVQRKMIVQEPKLQRLVSIDIHMSPDLLRTFFPGKDGNLTPELGFLVKGNDWQALLYPETTPAVNSVAQQIVNCPYQGITKRMYLQAKVLELMALQLAPILAQGGLQPQPRLKAQTIARIHHVREILLSRLDNPPSLLDLAQQVGVSDRTLRRGFQELFGTTVFSYLIDQRLKRAEQLLRGGNRSVAEVANLVGYSHLGQFAGVFKRKFGITPSECLLGKKSGSR